MVTYRSHFVAAVFMLMLVCSLAVIIPVFAQETPPAPTVAPAESAIPAAPEAPPAPPTETVVTPSSEATPAPVVPAEAGPAPAAPATETLEVPAPIVDVIITGNQQIPTEDILKVVQSKAGGRFSDADVARDRQAISNLGWFQRVSADQEALDDGIRITFRVIENPVITGIQFEGNRELSRDELLAVMKTTPNQLYNARMLTADVERIERLYASKGFILALVRSQQMSNEGVLTLSIAEGVIEAIRITGNSHTKTYAIQRYLKTKVGETYNDAKVARDIARLNALGWFETVRRDAEVGSEAGKVIVIITVVEKKRSGMVSFGGGYSSTQGAVAFVDLSKGNLGGNGQQASIRGEFGGRTSYELGYQNPWVMNPETRMSIGLYDRLILREAFATDESSNPVHILYDERRSGGNILFGRPLSDRTTAFLGIRMDNISIEDVSETEAPFLDDAVFAPRDVRSISLAGVNDTRNDPYNPRAGTYQRYAAEFAGIIGGVDFNKYTLETRKFFPMGRKNALALRLMGGKITGDPPYLEQFLIGGTESMRGFPNDRFAGVNMAVFNTEYRFPLTDNLLGVLFVDLGDAWGTVSDSDTSVDAIHESFSLHTGYGVGVRVKTPIGPFRLDLGFSEEGTETHFSVRNMF
jgi:outer membrane protein insertion porin family